MKIIKRTLAMILAIYIMMAWCPIFPINEANAGMSAGSTYIIVSDFQGGALGIDVLAGLVYFGVTAEGIKCATIDGPGTLWDTDIWWIRDTFPNLSTFKVEYKTDFSYSTIPLNAFLGKQELKIVTIRQDTQYIGENAFNSCPKLSGVNISGVKSIGKGAFSNSGTIGTGLTSISFDKAKDVLDSAFEGCTKLTSVSLPAATNIAQYVFKNCDALKNITLEEATYIGWGAFEECDVLETVNFPKATHIKDYAFYNCTNLKNVNLPIVDRIDWNAFLNCTSLEKISLPKVTFIGIDSFNNCKKLNTMILGETVPKVDQDDNFENCPTDRTVYVPAHAIGAYDPDGNGKWYGWKVDSIRTGNDITSFSFNGLNPNVVGVINNNTINLTVPYGTDITKLSPTISVSDKATISPANGVEKDFTNPVTYTVTAQNKEVKKYTVNVNITPNHEKKIESFIFEDFDPDVEGVIDHTNNTIELTVPYDTDITSITPTIIVSSDTTISPASGEIQDFTNPVTYTVMAQNGDEQIYTVKVNKTQNDKNEIKSFIFEELDPDIAGVVDNTTNTVKLIVPFGTDSTKLTPTINISGDAIIDPVSGVEQDFTNPIIYKVRAQNGDERDYTVTAQVSVYPSIAASDFTWVAECEIDEEDVLRESGAVSNVPVNVIDWGGLNNQNPTAGSYKIKLQAANGEYVVQKEIIVNVVAHVGNGAFNITAQSNTIFTSRLENLTRTLIVNKGVTGFKYFEVHISKLSGHPKEETLVFAHYRNGKMLSIFASPDDYDKKTKAMAGFNVQPGDKIKVFIVDKLTNDPKINPNIL